VIRDREAPLPARVAARLAGHVLARAFEADEGVFGHATRVEVYRPAPRATSAPGAQEP
jgi:hypothetical protein